VAMVILAYMSFRVGEYGFGLREGYTVSAVFESVSGLKRDAFVQIAGVEVGRVERISLKNGRAEVVMRIIPSVRLEKDVTASLRTYGILGDKYVDIAPGTPESGYLPEGGEIVYVEMPADLDKLLRELGTIANDVMAVTASLRHVIGGDEGEANLRSIVENTRDLMVNLNRVVERSDKSFGQLSESLTAASREMQRTFTALSDISERISRGEGTLGQLVENRELFDNLTTTVASIQKITDQISTGEGTIGKLIYEDETVENINLGLKSIDRSMESINRYISKTEQFRTFVGYRGEYLTRSDKAKSYFQVRIQPREDMFYILGLVSDPRGRRTITERSIGGALPVRIEEYDKSGLLFDAQIGKRFKDLALRGGIFESTGGVAADFYTLNDNLKVTLEAFDFDDERRTHLKVYAAYQLFRNVHLTAGWDDFISKHGNSSPFLGLSIHFEDRDLKYILSSVPTSP